MTDKKELLMNKLGISEEEAAELIAFDKGVDKGTIKDNLTKEQKAAVKKYTRADRVKAVNAYGKATTREKKVDTEKNEILTTLFAALQNSFELDKIEMTNPNKIITFVKNGEEFVIDLKKSRKK